MEFTKLSKVELLSEATDTANVLIEDGNGVKRVPKSEVGFKLPEGGTAGQTLIKTEDGEGWGDIPEVPGVAFVTFEYDLDNAEYTGCSHTFDQALDMLANGTPALFLVRETNSYTVETAFGEGVVANDENGYTVEFTSGTITYLSFTFSNGEGLKWYPDGTLSAYSGK